MIRTLAEIEADGTVIRVTAEDVARPAGERLYTAREVGDLQASEAELVSAPLRRKLAETERELARRTEEREERERARAGQEARVRELERLLALSVAREDALEIKVQSLIGDLTTAENRVQTLEAELGKRPTELDLAAVRADRDKARDRAVRLERLLAREVDRADRAEEQVRRYDQDRHTERDRADQNRAWAERAELRVAQMAEEKREAIERMADQIGKVSNAVHTVPVTQALRRVHEGWEYQMMAEAIRIVRTILGPPGPPTTPTGSEAQA